ncbi:hypothetical protein BBK36DRAFT_1106615, partial [Trichoderma citrinoviride]
PSKDEAKLYYHGLASHPRLVARSSTQVWQGPRMSESSDDDSSDPLDIKWLGPLRNPLLKRFWKGTSPLRGQILDAVKTTSVTAIDLLGIELNGKYQDTLMISVVSGTLSREDGHPIAMQCKTILENHGISDVTCEIRES